MLGRNYQTLLEQVEAIKDEDSLKDYHAFVYWFIETVFGLEKQKILNSICDGMHDKGVDAIVIDSIEKHVTIIQSKFERAGGVSQIKEAEIKQFAAVGNYFKSRRSLEAAMPHANPVASRLLNDAFEAIRNKHHTSELVFITSHKNAPQIEGLIHQTLGFKAGEFTVYPYDRIIQLLGDKIRDFTPPLGVYCLPYDDTNKAMIRTSEHRSWVMTVPLDAIRSIVNKFKDDLFRMNVRNFLGFNRCNKGMKETLRDKPEYFWYFNNGICILCDEGTLDVENKYIRLVNPQIVNGCQTARSIEKFQGELKGNVLVRVIECKEHEFISALTLYQNSSNPVKKRDLKSNDPTQVRLKQELKRRGYYYEIKRGEELSSMAKKYPAMKQEYQWGAISNEDVAKALSAIDLNPAIAVGKGSEAFFDELYDDLFPSDVSTFHCLAPFLVHNMLIRQTYVGTNKKFHSFEKAYVFKNRAAFYVLCLMNNALKDGEEKMWEKKFVLFYERAKENEWKRFFRQMEKIVSGYFEIVYKSWRRAFEKFELDHDTYLKNSSTIDEIGRRFGRLLRPVSNEVKKVFANLVPKGSS